MRKNINEMVVKITRQVTQQKKTDIIWKYFLSINYSLNVQR